MGESKRTFRAKPKSWGLGHTKGGREQVAVEFEILTPDADVQVITWYGYFTEATFKRTVESLRYCGWKGDDLEQLEGLDQEVDLVIEDETYEGKTFPKVQWVNRPGGLSIKAPLVGAAAKSFASAMRDRIRALDAASIGGQYGPSDKPRGGVLSPEPPPITEDDLQF